MMPWWLVGGRKREAGRYIRRNGVKRESVGGDCWSWWRLENGRLPSPTQVAPMVRHNRNKHKLSRVPVPLPALAAPRPSASLLGLVLGHP